MKPKLVSVLLASLTTATGPAPSVAAAPSGHAEMCATLATFASVVMSSHQVGVPLAAVLDIAGEDELLRSIVLSAYLRGRYATEAMQAREVADFRDHVHVLCLTTRTHD
jgi:hypothetical protein